MSLLEQLQSEFGQSVEAHTPQPQHTLDGLTPQAVAAPTSDEAAQALVAWCGRRRVAFVIGGGLSRWHIGAVPTRFDLLISTQKLNRVWDFDEGNATIEAGSGISLHELEKVVREKNQFVPLSASDENSTLGGAIATGMSGAQSWKYGMPRDLVTGVHVALSDGRVVRGGGKVVKNVSGYDLPKIFTGSFGTLGLITRVTLRLRPQSPDVRDYLRTCDAAQIPQRAREILSGPFDATLLRANFDGKRWHLHARFEGASQSIQTQIDQLAPGDTTSSASTCNALSAVELRAGLPISSAWNWARQCEEIGATFIEWDAANGRVFAQFARLELEELGRLRASATKSAGWMRLERGPIEWKSADLVWGEVRNDWALMRALKEKFDVANACAPGRFVGGL